MTDKHEFNKIYSKYKNLVYKIAYMTYPDYNQAQDILQETFLQLYIDMGKKHYYSEEDYENIKAWLVLVAKNKARNYLKANKKNDECCELFETDIVGGNPEDEMLKKQQNEEYLGLQERIYDALEKKNPRWNRAIFLSCQLKMSQQEAAAQMGMTPDAFYVMMNRARTWIRKNFGIEFDEIQKYTEK